MRLTPTLVITMPFLAMLYACVGPAPRAPVPDTPTPRTTPPAPVQPASPAPTAIEWLHRPVAPGVWTYQGDGTGSFARFGAAASLTVRCDRATRRVSIVRTGAGQGAMVVRTSYGAVTLPATALAGGAPQTVAVRAASDATLDQIAYSRGKFAVELPGGELSGSQVSGTGPLIVPAWPEVARVIEDCRG